MDKVRLSFAEKWRLIWPWAAHNVREQMLVVLPVCLYIMLFQWLILRYPLTLMGWLMGGIVMVFLGLAFFLEGIRMGLVPIGEIVGNTLPKKRGPAAILIFAFFLGLLASFGEPVLGTLQVAGASLKPEHAPLLYALLVEKPAYLVVTVSLGVGIAVVIGTLRFLYGWSLKPIVLPLVLLAIGLTLWAARTPELASAIGLAWDTGAVIVGPVLCPLVLALGLGVCRASGRMSPSLSGFGMVGLISVVPIAAVVLLTFGLYAMGVGRTQPHGHGPAAAVPVTETVKAVTLPETLDFKTYYPKIRSLQVPDEVKFADTTRWPAERRALFERAYERQGEGSRLRSSIPPADRKALPELLTWAGVNLVASPWSLFHRVYDVRVTDEDRLLGEMRLKAGADPADRQQVSGLLKAIGYMEPLSLLGESLLLGARAILPIFFFLYIIMRLLRKSGPHPGQLAVSVVFMVLGLGLFFFGLSVGLGTLGSQVGNRLPAAFMDYLPLYPAQGALFAGEWGKIVVIIFALILGYGATLAEPAFNVLGQQVEDVTQGAFKKSLFSQSVAIGVGIGAALGIASLLYGINLLVLLLPPYILLAILTVVNREIFVNIAWDGGAVTTGPVTVPVKLAIGLSLSMATGAGEGFGVLALASAYPVLIILLLGLFLRGKKAAATPAVG